MLMVHRSWSHSKSSGKKGPTARSVMVIHYCYVLLLVVMDPEKSLRKMLG